MRPSTQLRTRSSTTPGKIVELIDDEPKSQGDVDSRKGEDRRRARMEATRARLTSAVYNRLLRERLFGGPKVGIALAALPTPAEGTRGVRNSGLLPADRRRVAGSVR